MNKVLALVISGLLCACGGSPDETGSSLKQSPSSDSISLDDGSNYGSPCDRRDTQQITVDGHTYVIDVPTLCNPYLGIDKGDPPPDRWQPWDDKENFYAPHANPGSQSSPANQR